MRALTPGLPALAVLIGLAACRAQSSETTEVLDLVHLFPKADARAADPAEQAFQIVDVDLGGDTRRSLRASAPSRIIWVVSIPRDATLRVAVGVPTGFGMERRGPEAFRIGISDNRIYEILFQRTVDEMPEALGRWAPVEVGLHRYAGWQWSLFYHPSRNPWRIVFSLDARAGAEGAYAFWGAPRIEGRR